MRTETIVALHENNYLQYKIFLRRPYLNRGLMEPILQKYLEVWEIWVQLEEKKDILNYFFTCIFPGR